MYPTIRKPAAAALGVAALAALGLVACSDDGDDGDAVDAAEATTTTRGDDEIAADPDDPYCAIERQIDGFFEEAFAGLGPDATEEEQRAAVQAASRGVVDSGLIDEGLAVAPDVLRSDLELLVANVQAAADGNVEVFFTPESDAAGAHVDAYCGLED